MNECNHQHNLATGNCIFCKHNMLMDAQEKPPVPNDLANMEFDVGADTGPTDSDPKLFNCYRHNSSEPLEIECDYYGEEETFIHFYVDGDPVLSMIKSGISYIVLASIDKNKEREAQFQRKKTTRQPLARN